MRRQSTLSISACLTCPTRFLHPVPLVPPSSGAGYSDPLHGSTYPRAQTYEYAERAGWWVRGKKGEDKKHPSKRRVPKPGIDQALCVKEKHYKQERRNKSGKFISALPKRSECDKRPPVVRRSVAGQPLSKHSLGDGRGIRHGSDCGETQPGWKQKAPSRLPGNYLQNNCLVKLFH